MEWKLSINQTSIQVIQVEFRHFETGQTLGKITQNLGMPVPRYEETIEVQTIDGRHQDFMVRNVAWNYKDGYPRVIIRVV